MIRVWEEVSQSCLIGLRSLNLEALTYLRRGLTIATWTDYRSSQRLSHGLNRRRFVPSPYNRNPFSTTLWRHAWSPCGCGIQFHQAALGGVGGVGGGMWRMWSLSSADFCSRKEGSSRESRILTASSDVTTPLPLSPDFLVSGGHHAALGGGSREMSSPPQLLQCSPSYISPWCVTTAKGGVPWSSA